jgi:DNA (cytosine-5)-methyltransferase 1
MRKSNNLNYVSLFSSAGVGCFGFKEENFDCIATNELIERRLNIQRINKKCLYESGYVSGDIQEETVKNKIFKEIDFWKKNEGITEIDVLISTPPCQGMSIANHKKRNELSRNSLVIESIILTKKINPKIFIFENVRAFLKTICTDIDKKDKKIEEAIEKNLSQRYNFISKIINFKEYGVPSSRTRTIVIGVRKDLKDLSPEDLFPNQEFPKTIFQAISHLSPLKKMGEISEKDIYHNFRRYEERMLDWIKPLKEGQSAFDNKKIMKRPHRIIEGKIVQNQNKNGDKYRKCFWDQIAPCIHTRNDILASQSTIHPRDNRVFSIRELMIFMSIPIKFKWTIEELSELNILSPENKKIYLKKNEVNIRQSIGEAVPTLLFQKIAKRINKALKK